MATTAYIKNGLVIEHKNDLYRIVEFQHVKPGKGGAFVRTRLKNLKTGEQKPLDLPAAIAEVGAHGTR